MFRFNGDSILYNDKTLPLNEHTIYLDGSLSADDIAKYPHVYNDICEVLQHALVNGTETEPMQVYIAPYVYWIDDPEATDTLQKADGYLLPYSMIVTCEHLHLHGLTDNPYQVVIAGNRGQSNGANGNYTMFHFTGDGLTMKNLTLGNYCSIDLDYPWNPALNHQKRTTTITQAQLATLSGDKFLAINCNFISRLNLRPVAGGERSLYYNCHFESTDDALNGYAVYEKCSFDFYGGRPLYNTYRGGAIFLDCDFYSKMMNVESEAHQYFTKEGGPVTAIDCRFHSDYGNLADVDFNWTRYPLPSLRCYSHALTHNGALLTIESDVTVVLEEKELLNAYRLEQNGEIIYNTYNLLRGHDDWDPLNRKEALAATGKKYLDIPTLMTGVSSAENLVSGQDTATLKAEVFTFTEENVTASNSIQWRVADSNADYVNLIDNNDGTCTVTGCNSENSAKQVLITASTPSGLETAIELTVKPFLQEAPTFVDTPSLELENGALTLHYVLALEDAKDTSDVRWYRCIDCNSTVQRSHIDTEAATDAPILTAVSRCGKPETTYPLTAGDIGYHIMATITPKSSNSESGEMISVITERPISAESITNPTCLYTDFHSFPHTKQAIVKPGFWTVDHFRPADTAAFGTWFSNDTDTPWVYDYAGNGCIGCGLYQGTQGARLMYTPVSDNTKDMRLKLTVDPAKTAGQGFGSADQYMDICLKFDTASLSGYGLRIVRTRAASNAVSMMLVKYTDGKTTFLTEPVIASCYQTGCTIELKVIDFCLTAHVESTTPQLADQKEMGWQHTVDLKAEIEPSPFGGICIQHTGSVGTGGWQNSTMLHTLEIEYL